MCQSAQNVHRVDPKEPRLGTLGSFHPFSCIFFGTYHLHVTVGILIPFEHKE